MRFYQIPDNLNLKIEELESAIRDFQTGNIHPTRFRALRVTFGVYEQRQPDTFMMRVRCTAGCITPEQLICVAELAKQYGKPEMHITTRQELQIHDIVLNDVPEIMRTLKEKGLSSRGGGGNTIRNIMASFDSGINPDEVFDVTPHAIALCSEVINEEDALHLPRKFKISFSNGTHDHALAVFNDLGFIATMVNGEKGFQIWVAGGMGCRPRTGRCLHSFVPENRMLAVYRALKKLFLDYGNRKNKNSSRLRFLWDELGESRFRQIYGEYFDAEGIISFEPGTAVIPHSINGTMDIFGLKASGSAFETWKDRYVVPQKQTGFSAVHLPFNLGDIKAEDGIRLGKLLQPLGEDVMRLTMRQNIQIRNIPDTFLGALFEGISELDTLSHLNPVFGNTVACAGASTCTTGVCLSRGAANAIQRYLLGAAKSPDQLPNVTINISGCPNSCGQHHVAELGLYGRVARHGGSVFPAYWILCGAQTDPENPRLAEKVNWVPARSLPVAMVEIIEAYGRQRHRFSRFTAFFENGGKAIISEICSKYQRQIPTIDQDRQFYHDWTARSAFTTVNLGHGECSAGIYDMIEAEMDAIKENRRVFRSTAGPEERGRNLWNQVFSAANMLLVTRGVDPRTETATFQYFIAHFIDTNIVPKRFFDIIAAAMNNDIMALEQQQETIEELGDLMIQLYHQMDNSLRFPGERTDNRESSAVSCEISETGGQQVDKHKDLRGVACPMNFVKTKVELAGLQSGQVLEIWLDDGEPIDNVPRSVKSEKHTVLSQEKFEDYWKVVIKKA